MTVTTQSGGMRGLGAEISPAGLAWLALAVISTLPLFW